MKCPKCGVEVKAEDRFCGDCGFSLETETPVDEKKTSIGLSENCEGALCYLFGWITGIFFLLFEKKNKFVQFHAFQSLITFIILGFMITLFLEVDVIVGLLFLLEIFLWIFLMYKAFIGEKYKLPVIGDFAEKHSQV